MQAVTERVKTQEEKLGELAATFPSLNRRAAYTRVAIERIAKNASESNGARSAAAFCLWVWDSGRNAFDMRAAWDRWDNDHRRAWKDWAQEPWFA